MKLTLTTDDGEVIFTWGARKLAEFGVLAVSPCPHDFGQEIVKQIQQARERGKH